MSKMDRQLNSKNDKETIYEIYRACRLCGAGAGYKMPIIQNVLDVDDTEVELKLKVRECLQIEVHQDDKMPPLICELCVDKVNDFYEFLEMCRETNKRTRLRLGLPPQSMPRGAPDAGECILGLTEPVYVNDDSDGEPISKQKKMNPKVKVKREPELKVREMNPKVKVKREPELKVRLENRILTESRSTRNSRRDPTPPRVTRLRTSSKEDNMSLSRLKDNKPKSSAKPAPKSILKKETKDEDNLSLAPRLKRSRDKEPVKLETPNKKVKITTTKTSPPTPKTSPVASPRTPKTPPISSPRTRPPKPLKVPPMRAPSPPRLHKCGVCGQANKTSQANANHKKIHTVGFTQPKVACNPCGEWFTTPEEASAHHKNHRNRTPYECRRCFAEFKYLSAYDDHFINKQCLPSYEVPDVKCDECWHLFATNRLLDEHKCLGEDQRPGGKCGKCLKSYVLLKNLKKHEQTCTAKKKGEFIVDPVLLDGLKPVQIRVSRCDPLLTNLKQNHYDVSNVTADFGLDKNCFYPYISSYSRLRIKSDPDGMVDIKDEIRDEFYTEEDYVHWDSEDSEPDEEESSLVLKQKKIDTLANLTLKTLFSKRCLGKVPKKKRRVNQGKMFDSLLAGSEDDVTRDINNIIDNLGDDGDEFDGSQKGDDNQKRDESQKDDTDKSLDVSDDKNLSNVDDNKKNSDNDILEKTEQNAQNHEYSEKYDQNMSEKDGKNFKSVCNDKGSNNNISSDNDNNKRIDDKVNNGLNSFSFDYFDGEVVSKNGRDNQNDEELKIDYENSQDSNSIGAVSESLLNDNNDGSDRDINDKVSNDVENTTSLTEQTSDVDENKSQTDEFSVDNLSQESKISETDVKTNESSQSSDEKSESIQGKDDQSDNTQGNDEQNNEVQKNDNVTESDYKNAISVIVNCGKSRTATDSQEMNDSRLMEALNAEIGNSSESSRDQVNSRGQGNESLNDKIAVDDVISAKSSDMGGYQDFNFDA